MKIIGENLNARFIDLSISGQRESAKINAPGRRTHSNLPFDRIKLLSIHRMNKTIYQDIHIAHMSDKHDTAFGPTSALWISPF